MRGDTKSLLVIPALNEAENIGGLLDKILALGLRDVDILVVDDHSDDETRRCVSQKGRQAASVSVIDNPWPEHGLAYCYKAGFRYALERGYAWVLGMDADFSHDPSDIPRLLEERPQADWIIGSRYVPGGSAAGLGPGRWLISRMANVYLGRRLRIPVKDLTSGFNCLKTAFLREMDFEALQTKGFAFQVESKVLAFMKGCRFREVPIRFQPRKAGRSKFGLSIFLEAFRKLRHLELLLHPRSRS